VQKNRDAKEVETLTGELKTATLRALRVAYQELNELLFGSSLKIPVLGLSDAQQRLGYWDLENRSLEISRTLLLEKGWGAAVEVLKHEMAHQFVHEVLGNVDAPSHGAAFREVCDRRSIDGRAGGNVETGDALHPVLDRIRKLLSLAQSSNVHEAQSATRVAQRLMLKHNIDRLSAERQSGYASRQLGRVTGRVSESERLLGAILGDHFFVDVIWVYSYRPLVGKYGRVMEVCGARENLELADYVHHFVTMTAERFWREHKRAAGIRNDRQRRAYLAGVMSGFREQLDSQVKDQASHGLVWLGDPKLSQYFKRRHPRISTRSYDAQENTPTRAQGRQAGRKLVLHRGLHSKQGEGSARRQIAARSQGNRPVVG